MSKKNILADAIADAKSIKEAALANAKAAIAEHFAPTLKSMISAELHEELEDDLNDKNKATNEVADEDLDGKKIKEVAEEDLDESSDLDALLKELEAGDDDDAEDEIDEKFAAKDDNASTDDSDKITPMDEKGDEAEGGEEKDSKDADYELYLQLRKKFEPKPSEKPKDEGDSSQDGDQGSEEGFDIESIIKELEAESGDDSEEGDDSMDEKFAKKDDNASKDDSDKIKPMDEKVQKELAQVAEMKKEMNEVNLLNAKLLYFGKVVKEQDNLTKSEKVGLLKQFDKATTVNEAKIIYGAITESLKSNKSKKNTKQAKENLGFASKAAGSAPKKASSNDNIMNEETVNRFKFLAGLSD